MKCLTICQPYPHLILSPDEQLPHGVERKRVENRTWPTAYRGPLLIHAGKSRAWLQPVDTYMIPHLVFGAIVGAADLVDCVEVGDVLVLDRTLPIVQTIDGKCPWLPNYPWLLKHRHAEGPFCWILDNVRRFAVPLPYRGRQGLFDVPDEIIRTHLASAELVS